MRRKFKNANGQLVTKGLFLEPACWDTTFVVYTLKEEDYEYKGVVYPSLYKRYMEIADLTEYEFATQCFHSWRHWELIKDAPWIAKHLKEWRTELELKLKSRAIKEIGLEAFSAGKNAFAALKWIVEKGYVDKPAEGSRRGRPSKQDIREQAAEMAFSDEQIKQDLIRLGIN